MQSTDPNLPSDAIVLRVVPTSHLLSLSSSQAAMACVKSACGCMLRCQDRNSLIQASHPRLVACPAFQKDAASSLGFGSRKQPGRPRIDARKICNFRNEIQQNNIAEQRKQEALDAGKTPEDDTYTTTLSPREQLRCKVASDVEADLVLRQLQDLHTHVDAEQGLMDAMLESASIPTKGYDTTEQLLLWVLEATDMMAMKSPVATLELLERCPQLCQVPLPTITARVLQLKLLLPAADVSEIIRNKPSLLLLEDMEGPILGALSKLHALMPGIPVEARLHEGGTVWWSFVSLLK